MFSNKKIFVMVSIITLGVLVFIMSVHSDSEYRHAVISTNKGDISVKLAIKDAPITTANFIKLVGEEFYNNITFHRVEKGFVIQGGDPRGDGTGGSNEPIDLEIKCKDGRMIVGETAPSDCEPVLTHKRGALSMARTNNPNSASSQFFITLNNTYFLDKNYAVFGYVTEGMEVVDNIAVGDYMKTIKLKD